jgi:methyl-accepting chemotaxis protein
MSKTKTAIGVAALQTPFILLLLTIWSKSEATRDSLSRARVGSNIAATVLAPVSSIVFWALLLFGCTAILSAGFVYLYGRAAADTMRAMSQALCQADISQDLATRGTASKVCSDYNGFVKKLRETLARTRKLGLEVAVGSTEVADSVKALRAKSTKNAELSETIFFASADMKIKIVDVLTRTHSIQNATMSSLANASTQLEELRKVTKAVDRTGKSATQFSRTTEQLNTTSLRISSLVKLVEEVCSQLHVLALRTGSEAVRAGNKGRDFTLISKDMKNLAEQANAASGSHILIELSAMMREVNSLGGDIRKDVEQVDQAIGNTVRQFALLVNTFEENNDQLCGISEAVDQLSSKNVLIHSQVADMRGHSKQVEEILKASAQSATGMNRKTEALLEAVAYFKIGNDPLEEKIVAVTAYRDLVQSKIADMAKRRINVFDHHYVPVPNTNPQKYRTAYDTYFDKELQEVFDEAIKEMDGTYCVAVDVNGYIATHHSKVSKPLTGDATVDLLYSRDKRIYNSKDSELRRVKHTNRFLLQTYMRDTGEIVNDLSMPIFIDGKHWGALVAGFIPARIMSAGRK